MPLQLLGRSRWASIRPVRVAPGDLRAASAGTGRGQHSLCPFAHPWMALTRLLIASAWPARRAACPWPRASAPEHDRLGLAAALHRAGARPRRQDGRLLGPFADRSGALVPVGAHLLLHRVLDGAGRLYRLELDPADPYPPLAGRLSSSVAQLAVYLVTRRERVPAPCRATLPRPLEKKNPRGQVSCSPAVI